MIVSQYWTQRLLTCSPNSVVIHQDLMLLHASTTASHWLYHLTTSICFNQAWTLSHIISSSVSIKETQCIDTDYNCGFRTYQSGNHIHPFHGDRNLDRATNSAAYQYPRGWLSISIPKTLIEIFDGNSWVVQHTWC